MKTKITKEVIKNYIQAVNLVNNYFKDDTIISHFLTNCELTPDIVDDKNVSVKVWDEYYGFVVIVKGHLNRFYLGKITFNELPTLSLEEMISRYKLDIIEKMELVYKDKIKKLNEPLLVAYKTEPVELIHNK
jgi:hypothetical protein